MKPRKILPVVLLLVQGLAASVTPAQELDGCTRGEGFVYGHPIVIERVIPLASETSASPLARRLFPEGDLARAAADGDFECRGGEIIGALDCVAARMEATAADGIAAGESEVEIAAARAAAGRDLADPAPDAPANAPRELRQIIQLRPVLMPGSPGSLRYEPDGPPTILLPGTLSDAEIGRVAPLIAGQNAALRDFVAPLETAAREALIDGIALPAPLPPLPDGMEQIGTPTLSMPAECASLFRGQSELADLRGARPHILERIKEIRRRIASEREKAGLLGKLWDGAETDRLEEILTHEEDKLRRTDGRIAELEGVLKRRERALDRDDRARQLGEVKADPERRAAEEERRRAALIEAEQETAKAKWLYIEGEATYAGELAARDAQIAAARERGEDALADALEEDRARLERARDSWREHAQAMIDRRAEDARALVAQNITDGIGPATDATTLLLAEGKNPVEVLEAGARERAREAAARRVAGDAETLGGSATESYGLADFGQDAFDAYIDAHTDPLTFYKRFGHFAKGVGEAAYDGVADIARIGYEAADLAGETFESHLSGVTGYEFNTFGRENLEALVRADNAVKKIDAIQIGEMAKSVAEHADRRFGQMAASGESGVNSALESVGYATGSLFSAEEQAVGAALKGASLASDTFVWADNVADAARGAGAGKAAKAGRLADAPGPLPPPTASRIEPAPGGAAPRIDRVAGLDQPAVSGPPPGSVPASPPAGASALAPTRIEPAPGGAPPRIGDAMAAASRGDSAKTLHIADVTEAYAPPDVRVNAPGAVARMPDGPAPRKAAELAPIEPRAPPDAPRRYRPLKPDRLDSDLDTTPGYRFAQPLLDIESIPSGGRIEGQPIEIPRASGETLVLPGNRLVTPDGRSIELDRLLGAGATASAFQKAGDPTKAIRLVDLSNDAQVKLDRIGRRVAEMVQDPSGNGLFRVSRADESFIVGDPHTPGRRFLATVEENVAHTGRGFTNARDRFRNAPPNSAQELTMALAMRELNNRGVVWTDHKLANFDVVPNPQSPTGYQMLIFDTGGIYPVTGATAETRAATAREIQRIFDTSPSSDAREWLQFKGNALRAHVYIDERAFAGAGPPLLFTPGNINRNDKYIELSILDDAGLSAHARSLGIKGPVLGPPTGR